MKTNQLLALLEDKFNGLRLRECFWKHMANGYNMLLY